MYKVKKYIISLGIMMLVAIVSLLIVSTLTYIFKWQEDKATIGIVVTYILTGVAGGFSIAYAEKKETWKTVLEILLVYVIFIMLLRGISFVVNAL